MLHFVGSGVDFPPQVYARYATTMQRESPVQRIKRVARLYHRLQVVLELFFTPSFKSKYHSLQCLFLPYVTLVIDLGTAG